MLLMPSAHRSGVRACVFFVVGLVACTNRPAANLIYQARRDEYCRTFSARFKNGESLVAANDSAIRALDSLLRPIVGDFSAPWIVGRGRINLQSLVSVDMVSGLPDGMLYQSQDSSTQVLVTTHDLMRSWIAWLFARDTVVSGDPRVALGSDDVLTQLFDVDAHVYSYTDIPVDNARLGIVSAKLVARSQDYSPRPADELIVSVARGTRIFIIDTPAHDTLPIPPSCQAAGGSGHARSKSLVDSAFRTRPPDSAFIAKVFHNDDLTNSQFLRCYGETVAREPRFQDLVAQVRRLVEALPAR